MRLDKRTGPSLRLKAPKWCAPHPSRTIRKHFGQIVRLWSNPTVYCAQFPVLAPFIEWRFFLVLAVAVLAPLATTVWFTLLGGTGIYYQLTDVIDITEALENFQFDVATLTVAQALPGGTWMAMAILLLTTIFVAASGLCHGARARAHRLISAYKPCSSRRITCGCWLT